MKKEKVLVVFSGGQDSTTCLYWAKKEYEQVVALTFDYGQRHRIELDCASHIASLAQVPYFILPIDTFSKLSGNALVDSSMNIENHSHEELPNTFVPGRNLIFLTFAAAFAYQHQIQTIITGVCQTDYSGYPDCREDTIQSLEKTLFLGLDYQIKIITPLMHLTKAETVKLAVACHAMEGLSYSHTCYHGHMPPCLKCPSCLLRQKGFEEAGIEDPLLVRFYKK